ncbi:MAG: type II toxin-antitoxin system Phd/YefM family antitoxin [Nonomuraea sp.]|nr:type II toxin-antitoxin system Phd/YefM family antitoxin [Nonomuraea sp.]NUP61105.1 type II toxin-antitoxin system Phd/YefM family antitoxin [Nonomuraea sp.]NUP79092.1 type II toxin-antitoxin system Phd/YefM family antitoxin [Nonomuraea sp.]NUT40831.1 type II toxin-antitoxin system Phd/YefM family antitoxin [Thermoactinospora sp.]
MATTRSEATRWRLQEAKQRFSEVIRRAHDEGPQVVTRHGRDVAVILDVAEYDRLKGEQPDFKEFLLSGPDLSDLDLTRDQSSAMREITFGDVE